VLYNVTSLPSVAIHMNSQANVRTGIRTLCFKQDKQDKQDKQKLRGWKNSTVVSRWQI